MGVTKASQWLTLPIAALSSGMFVALAPLRSSGQVPKSPTFQLLVQTIHTDGEDILTLTRVPTDGAPVEQSYVVSIPFVENGVSKIRSETRTRMVPPTKMALAIIDHDVTFQDLSGAVLSTNDVLAKIPNTGRQVVVVDPNLKEIPDGWKDILSPDVIIMRMSTNPR